MSDEKPKYVSIEVAREMKRREKTLEPFYKFVQEKRPDLSEEVINWADMIYDGKLSWSTDPLKYTLTVTCSTEAKMMMLIAQALGRSDGPTPGSGEPAEAGGQVHDGDHEADDLSGLREMRPDEDERGDLKAKIQKTPE